MAGTSDTSSRLGAQGRPSGTAPGCRGQVLVLLCAFAFWSCSDSTSHLDDGEQDGAAAPVDDGGLSLDRSPDDPPDGSPDMSFDRSVPTPDAESGPSDASLDGVADDTGGPDQRLVADAALEDEAVERCGPSEDRGILLDEDGDGRVDEGDGKRPCMCLRLPCYSGPTHELELEAGRCSAGTVVCEDNEWVSECVDQVHPVPEQCNEMDDDCDGTVDEGVLLNACGHCGETPEEVCGNDVDEDCDGSLDEHEDCIAPPTLECDPSVLVVDGDTAHLRATYGGEAAMADAAWSLVEQPAGSVVMLQGRTPLSRRLTPDMPGLYRIEVIATDVQERQVSCEIEVQMATPPLLRIELDWSVVPADAPADLDLHLKQFGGVWFGGEDCHFDNCLCPAADCGRPEHQARLEADVRDRGPEVITVPQPIIGSRFRIGAHFFNNIELVDGAPAIFARPRVTVFCGGDMPAAVFDPQPLISAGVEDARVDSEFWEVADIRWRREGCEVTPLEEPPCARICTVQQARRFDGCPPGEMRGEECGGGLPAEGE